MTFKYLRLHNCFGPTNGGQLQYTDAIQLVWLTGFREPIFPIPTTTVLAKGHIQPFVNILQFAWFEAKVRRL